MEGNDQAVVAGEAGPVLGFWSRLGNIFANPRKTFEAVDQKPTWLVPLLILIILAILSTQLMFDEIVKEQMEKARNNPNITSEQLAQQEEMFADNPLIWRVVFSIGSLFAFSVWFLALAGIFYFVGSVILGGDSSFKRLLSVVCWSGCILILSTIVTVPLMMAKGNMNVSLSLALLLPAEAIDTRLYTLLSKFDFFMIWFIAVFATGFGIVYKFTTAKAYTAVGILWAIWIALSVALSGVFKQFGM
jgi:hypothetical protein